MIEVGQKIRILLYMNGLTQVWLIGQLRERGIVTDKTEMSSVLKGTRVGKKANLILQTSIEILKEYQDGHGKKIEQFLP